MRGWSRLAQGTWPEGEHWNRYLGAAGKWIQSSPSRAERRSCRCFCQPAAGAERGGGCSNHGAGTLRVSTVLQNWLRFRHLFLVSLSLREGSHQLELRVPSWPWVRSCPALLDHGSGHPDSCHSCHRPWHLLPFLCLFPCKEPLQFEPPRKPPGVTRRYPDTVPCRTGSAMASPCSSVSLVAVASPRAPLSPVSPFSSPPRCSPTHGTHLARVNTRLL